MWYSTDTLPSWQVCSKIHNLIVFYKYKVNKSMIYIFFFNFECACLCVALLCTNAPKLSSSDCLITQWAQETGSACCHGKVWMLCSAKHCPVTLGKGQCCCLGCRVSTSMEQFLSLLMCGFFSVFWQASPWLDGGSWVINFRDHEIFSLNRSSTCFLNLYISKFYFTKIVGKIASLILLLPVNGNKEKCLVKTHTDQDRTCKLHQEMQNQGLPAERRWC